MTTTYPHQIAILNDMVVGVCRTGESLAEAVAREEKIVGETLSGYEAYTVRLIDNLDEMGEDENDVFRGEIWTDGRGYRYAVAAA